MAIVNQNFLDAANATFHAVFDEIFAGEQRGLFNAFTEIIPTDSKVNELDLLETMPVIRRWIGEKEFASIRASRLVSTIKTYESSLEISRLDLVADRIGLVTRRIASFVRSDARIYDKICTDRLIENPIGYDGVSLFSTSHPRGPSGTTQSNRTSTALSHSQHDAIMAAGASLRDENGEPLRIAYDTLMVGPKLQRIAMEITQSTERVIGISAAGEESGTRVAAAAIPNVYGPGSMIFGGGAMTLIINPRLVGDHDDYYYYFDTQRGPKPIVLFELRAPEAIERTASDGDARFLRDVYQYSIECDVAAEPGAWQVAYAGIL